MNPDIKAKWIEALRSGKYKQGRGYLRTIDGGYCCLGVLCDVMDSSEWGESNIMSVLYDGHSTSLPGSVRRMADIPLPVCVKLSDMNDSGSEGSTFAHIAKYIEENL